MNTLVKLTRNCNIILPEYFKKVIGSTDGRTYDSRRIGIDSGAIEDYALFIRLAILS